MFAGRITRITPSGTEMVAEPGGGPNGAAIGPDGALYVCNNDAMNPEGRGRIERIELASGRVERIIEEVSGEQLGCPNDLVFDHAGGFWFTDFGRARRRATQHGGIYYVDASGNPTEVVHPVDTPNGIGLSPDGSTLYWAETDSRRIVRRTVASPGVLARTTGDSSLTVVLGRPTDERLLVVGLRGNRRLDSLAVDAAGHVAVGTLLDSGITDVDPETGSTTLLRLPSWAADRLVTNICFGGVDLRTGFITLSETGRVVACDWPRPGLRLAFNA
jgi:gluconolactonase